MQFDRENGQVYEETLTTLPKRDNDDLVYVVQSGHVRERPTNECSAKGTRTLHNMALLKILRNLDLLYSDLLKAFPVPIVEQIWTAIKHRKLDGLRMWKLFAPLLASIDDSQTMVRKMTKRPPNSFAHAIDQISCLDCSWLTDLTLDGISLTMAGYVQMSKMQNLSSLAIFARYKHDRNFSDRVLRAWSADAQNGSFGKLRYMLISGHQDVTENSLMYLSSFQMLELFCTRGCRLDPSVWRNLDESRPEEWHDPVNGTFRRFLRAKSTALGMGRKDCEAPFPSSFHAYTAQCRRDEHSQDSKTPQLLMTLLPGRKQIERAVLSVNTLLRCFERIKDTSFKVRTNKDNKDHPSKYKRRKLRDSKLECLGDVLEGLS